jgi:hypothetical protein
MLHKVRSSCSFAKGRSLVTASVGLILLVSLTAINAFGAVQTVLYQASAFGTSAFVAGTILVGQTAPVSLQEPCGTNNNNDMVRGTAAGINDFPIVQGGAVNTTALSSPTMMSQASADTATITLLGGIITAQEIKSVSTTNLDGNGFHVSAAGSNFTNLLVAGIPYNGLPQPNTTINLLGLGYVVLNEQTSTITNKNGQLVVNMIHIHITVANLLGLQVGTEIIVSNATSGMVRANAPGIVTGNSFGTVVTSTLINSSQTAPVNLPCWGTGGQVLTNSVVGVNIPGVLSSGTVSDTGQSKLTNPYSNGQMTSQVQNLSLLSGLVSVNLMYSQVNATLNGFGGYFLTGIGSFTGLSVAGHPEINDGVPYNTTVSLAGLGNLYIKHVIRNYPNPHSMEVRMIELVVNQDNTYGLPIGADIVIGDAQITLIPSAGP